MCERLSVIHEGKFVETQMRRKALHFLTPHKQLNTRGFTLQVARYGPLNICANGTVTFSWQGMHGMFQIPTIACPSNFTAPKAEGYEYLAPPSNGGSFTWEVPNVTGQYWVTSQWPEDCKNGN